MPIELSPETEALVREEAARRGGDANSLAELLIREGLARGRNGAGERNGAAARSDVESVEAAWADFIGAVAVDDAPAGRDAEREFGRLLLERHRKRDS